jgi:hypothetical protein
MSVHQQLRPLLQQFTTYVGRGNLIAANTTLVRMIDIMATAIDTPCPCNCAAPSIAPPILPVIERVMPVVDPVTPPRGRGRPKKVR